VKKCAEASIHQLSPYQIVCQNCRGTRAPSINVIGGRRIDARECSMTPRDIEEYRALRSAITARGTARAWVVMAGLSVWAALIFASAALSSVPAAMLVPLLILAASFEGVFGLHVGAERIGRYLQVFHDDRWERTAMAFGQPLAGTSSDPLFLLVFGFATLINFMSVVLLGAVQVELVVIGAAHLLFLGRLLAARVSLERQRAADLARFGELFRDQA